MSFVAVVCVAGVLATLAFLPDPNKLDDLDRPQAP
jgi:hypothetical protein